MEGSRRGRCLVCKRLGPLNRSEDFLCEDCVNPEEIRTYCESCHTRGKIDLLKMNEEKIARLSKFLKPGTCFLFSHCNACSPQNRPETPAKVYSISARSYAAS